MRKTLAAVALAAAALGTTAPTALAGCYGVDGVAYACSSGEPGVTITQTSVCVYTGGDTCEPQYLPGVRVTKPGRPYVCVLNEICAP